MVEANPVQVFPVLPLRDIVVFPHMIVPLFVGRDKSVRALEDVMRADKRILLLAQKNASQDDPSPDDIHAVGTIGSVLQLLKLPDGTVKVLVEGAHRARVRGFTDNAEFFEAEAEILEEANNDPQELEALSRSVVAEFEQYVKLNKKITPEVLVSLNQIEDPDKLADTVASHLQLKIADKQELLEIQGVGERLERVYSLMEGEIGVMQVEKKIRGRVKRQMEKTQREYYLNEQLKAIQKELGEGEEGGGELAELEEKIAKTKLSKEAREKAGAELKKLRNMSPMSAEATVVRNYLDWILNIPWRKKSKIKKDINFAQKVLDDDHYGLEKVKERILEHLAVQQRAKKLKGPILCLAPGVGKTSLGQSIARATGRNFVRMSLGGVRDEAEIRGHRRTYIGSLPGKIVQSMKKAKTSNPLIMLDEVDKLGADFRGDPSAALLEVLDPEQNHAFNDHYLEVDYDLSDVMFITTANTLRIIPALLDRMEVLRISGYTEDEKVEIAKQHLLPPRSRSRRTASKRESGPCRTKLCVPSSVITPARRGSGTWSARSPAFRERRYAIFSSTAGNASTSPRRASRSTRACPVTGRASWRRRIWSASARASRGPRWAASCCRSKPSRFPARAASTSRASSATSCRNRRRPRPATCGRGRCRSASSRRRSRDATYTSMSRRERHPRTVPSAGIAMISAIVSVLTQNPVRRDIAMTGEITLRGRVLPIGGLKEKLLAALRAGVETVLIPKENEKDLAEIPDNVKRGLDIVAVGTVDDVLKLALTKPLIPIEWDEEAELAKVAAKGAEAEDLDGVVTH